MTDTEKKALVDLLTMNILRGVDSTGVAGIHRDPAKDPTVVRALGTPYGDGIESHGLFNLMSFDRLMKQPLKAIIGHNRAATKGEVSVRNSHPFKFSNIVGAHNGTLHYSCMKRLKDLNQGIEYGTDSESIFAAINSVGVKETVSTLEGAWALVWFDKRDNTLNFLRNGERTLHYSFDDSEKSLVWSSDHSPVTYACNRQKIQTSKKPKLFPENQWIRWTLPETGQKFSEPLQEEVKGYEYKYTGNGHRHFGTKNGVPGTWMHGTFTPNYSVVGDDKPYSDADWSEYYEDYGYGYGGNSNSNSKNDKDNEKDTPWFKEGEACPVERINHSTYSVDRSEAKDSPEKATVIHLLPPAKDPVAEARAVLAELHPPKTKPEEAKHARERLMSKIREKADRAFLNKFSLVVQTYKKKFDDTLNRVYYDDKKELWHHFKYSCATDQWAHDELPHPPNCVPFKVVNVDSGGNHSFAYKGKREKRVVYYKGWKREMLVRETFENRMKAGCVNCQRIPVWGNLVRFFSPTLFLCEYCQEMPHVVRMVGELEPHKHAL